MEEDKQDIIYSKENVYYKREKRKNTVLIIIIFILLIYIWYCFTYHLGYIRNSKDSIQNSNTIGTSSEADSEDKKDNKQEGPYELSKADRDKFNKEQNNNNNDFGSNTEGNNEISNVTNNTNNINANINSNNNTNNFEDKPVNNLTPEEIKSIKLIQTEDEKNFQELNNLNIFKNFEHKVSDLIYPGLSGEYEFNIENYSYKDIKYKISFMCNNPNNVNMMYKLKRNGIYIAGDKDTYVSVSELGKEGLYLKSMMGDKFLLEWKWIDTDNDVESSDKYIRNDYSLTIRGEI